MTTHTHRCLTHVRACSSAQKHTTSIALFSLLLLNQPVLVEAEDQAKFVEVPRLENPLKPPIDVGSDARPSFADIDNDGDFDVFIGDGSRVKYYENIGNITHPIFRERTGENNPLNDASEGISLDTRGHITLVDIDNDDDLDAFIGRGSGVEYYENTGNANQPIFEERTEGKNPLNGVHESDNIPFFVDIDGDGDLDVFIGTDEIVSGTFFGIVKYFENIGNINVPVFEERPETTYPFSRIENNRDSVSFISMADSTASVPRFVDIDNDNDMDAFIGSLEGTVRYYENTGTAKQPSFTEQTTNNPLNNVDVGSFSVPALIDIDGDSDLDAFIGSDEGVIKYYENIGTNKNSQFVKRTGLNNPFGGVVDNDIDNLTLVDIDNDGDLDAFAVKSNEPEPEPVKFYENTGNINEPSFVKGIGQNNPLQLVKEIDSSLPFALVDIDNDGDLDIFIGAKDGTVKFYENTGSASHAVFVVRIGQNNPLNGIDVVSNSAPTLVDIDNDYDLDAFIGTKEGIVRYYENMGSVNQPLFVESDINNPLGGINIERESIPTFFDIDNDGDLDAFIAGFTGTSRILYYKNVGNANQPRFERMDQNNPLSELHVGDDRPPTFVDINNDGDLDIFIVDDFKGIVKYYKNTSDVTQTLFVEQQSNPFSKFRFFTKLILIDIDNDNDLDAFIGTILGTVEYFENIGVAGQPLFVERTGQKNPLTDVKIRNFSQPTFIDIDADNDLDVFVGTPNGTVKYYENTGNVNQPIFIERTLQNNPLADVGVVGRRVTPVFADIDDDKDLDVVIGIFEDIITQKTETNAKLNVTLGGEVTVKYYENAGTVNQPLFIERIKQDNPFGNMKLRDFEKHFQELDLDSDLNFGLIEGRATLILDDMDNDNDLDVFIQKGLPMIAYFDGDGNLIAVNVRSIHINTSTSYENIGNRSEPIFVNGSFDNQSESTSINISEDPTLADIDNDGDVDAFILEKFSDTNKVFGSVKYHKNTKPASNALRKLYALPKSGVYNRKREISLNCIDCEKIYYTLDSTTEATPATEYTGPFEITANSTLKFFAIDAQGNSSEIQTEQYIIDTEPPEIEITWPEKGSNISSLTSIEGTVNANGSTEIDRIEVQVTDEHLYLDKGSFITSLTWLPIVPNEKWSLKGQVPLPIGTYTIKARVFDKAGNVAEDQITIKNLVYTSLSIESHPTILQNELLEVKGKLIRYPNTEALSKKIIAITTIAPDGTETTIDAVTDEEGNYTQYLSAFTHKGIYKLEVSFEGDDILQPSPSAPESKTQVRVGSSAGYAILIQGKVQGDERGALTYNKTLNRVYRKLKLKGFTDDNIRYFNYNTEQDIDGDGKNDDIFDVHHKMDIKTAIEEWVRDRINGSPAPLYIIMVDHGALETFYIHHENEDKNDDAITLNDLNQWLNTLESGLNETALKEPRVIIIGTCYSGSFIDATPSSTLSKKGRIIITSADKGESSSRGFMNEPDGILTGELFIEQLFDGLVYGDNDGVLLNFKAAFEQATKNIEKFTNNPVTLRSNRFADNAVQHPLLDDNGDGKGNNMLFINGDGQQVDSLFLGVVPKEGINSDKRPAYILEVTPTLRLDETQTAATLFLIANNSDKVDRTGTGATVKIRPPSKSFEAQDGSEQITFEDLETVELIYNTDRFETTYSGFNEKGKYELFYTVRDATTQDISPIQSSVVYKKIDGNARSHVRSPTKFKLVSPVDNTQTRTVLIFDWEDSEDFDNSPITYTLSIADDEAFKNVIYQQEELNASMTYVENAEKKPCGKRKNACLEDNTRYYWRVEAINNVGDGTVSDIWTFSTKDTNAPPGIASIQVYNALDYTPVENVDFTFNTFNKKSPEEIFADQGIYNFSLDFGLYEMWLTVPSYLPRRTRAKADFIPLKMTTGQATEINVFLEPCTGSSCENIQSAQFSLDTKLLTIPTVKVPDVGDFSLQLQGDDSLTFTILMDKLTQLSEATDYVAHLSSETGQWQLFIPRVKIVMPSGEEALYKVTMKLVNSDPLQFGLVDAVAIQ
jgi:hypothetical protein